MCNAFMCHASNPKPQLTGTAFTCVVQFNNFAGSPALSNRFQGAPCLLFQVGHLVAAHPTTPNLACSLLGQTNHHTQQHPAVCPYCIKLLVSENAYVCLAA